jgi:hypothetical protein
VSDNIRLVRQNIGAWVGTTGSGTTPPTDTNRVRLEDFGGSKTDGFDNYSALQAAISAISETSTILYIDGWYTFGSSGWTGIRIQNLDNIHIIGAGRYISGFKLLSIPSLYSPSVGYHGFLLFGQDDSDIKGLVLKDFSVNLNGIETSGIILRRCMNSIIENIEIYNSPNTFGPGYNWPSLYVTGGAHNFITQCYLHDVSSAFILGDNGSAAVGEYEGKTSFLLFVFNEIYNPWSTSAVSFSDSTFAYNKITGGPDTGTGAYGVNHAALEFACRSECKNVVFSHNVWKDIPGVGIQLSPYYITGNMHDIVIDHDQFVNIKSSGLYCFGAMRKIRIDGCTFSDCMHQSIYFGSSAMSDTTTGVPTEYSIKNNHIVCTNKLMVSENKIGISINLLDGALPDSMMYVEISGNLIKNIGLAGIFLNYNTSVSNQNARNINIFDNIIEDCFDPITNEGYGIAVSYVYFETYVSRNKIKNCGSYSIRSSARQYLTKIFDNYIDTPVSYVNDTTTEDKKNGYAQKPDMRGNFSYDSRAIPGILTTRLSTVIHSISLEDDGTLIVDCTYGNIFAVDLNRDISAVNVLNPVGYDRDGNHKIEFHFIRRSGIYYGISSIVFGDQYWLKSPLSVPSLGRVTTITFERQSAVGVMDASGNAQGFIETGRLGSDMTFQRYEGMHRIEKSLSIALTGNISSNTGFVFPKGCIPEYFISNLNVAASAESPTTNFCFGEEVYGYNDYGISDLSIDSKVNIVDLSGPVLTQDYRIWIHACDANGEKTTGHLTAGIVEFKFAYWINYSQDNTTTGPQTYTWDPGMLAAYGGYEEKTVTFTGAALFDKVFASLSTSPVDLDWVCVGQVISSNTIKIRLTNNSGTPTNLPSGNLNVYIKHPDRPGINIAEQAKRVSQFLPILTSIERYALPFISGAEVIDSNLKKKLFCTGTRWEVLASSIDFDLRNCYLRYKMDDLSGNLIDQFGNYPGIALGLGYNNNGILDKSIDFSGLNAAVDLGYHTQFASATSFTIEFCAKAKVIGSDSRDWFRRYIPGGSQIILYQASSNFSLYFGPAAASITLPLSTILSTLKFRHIVIIYNTGTVTIYVNGVAQTLTVSGVIPTSLPSNLNSLSGFTTIGYNIAIGNQGPNAYLDEFCMYTDAKSQDWVTKKYSSLFL